jgi:hypothetical protein
VYANVRAVVLVVSSASVAGLQGGTAHHGVHGHAVITYELAAKTAVTISSA